MRTEAAYELLEDLGATKLKTRTKGDASGTHEITHTCPLHDDHSPSAALNPEKESWVCSVCGGMSIPQLVFNVFDMDDFKQVSEYLEKFDFEGVSDYETGKGVKIKIKEWGETDKPKERNIPEAFFEHWGEEHPYIYKRIPDERTIKELEVHYDAGKQRIIFPVRNLRGKIIGWSERWAFDPKEKKNGRIILPKWVIDDMEDKNLELGEWKVENPRWRHEYDRMNYLYGAHLLAKKKSRKKRRVLVVEGFTTLAWLRAHGIRNVVAIGGSKISKMQVDLLLEIADEIISGLDNDDAGFNGTARIIKLCSEYFPVRVVDWKKDVKDFDGMDTVSIVRYLKNAVTSAQYSES